MKKQFLLVPLTIAFYHSSVASFNFSQLWQKVEEEKITKEFEVGDTCEIELFNTEGSYTIKPWNQKKISIEATKKGTEDERKLTTIKSAVAENNASITTTFTGEGKSASIDYVITVPENASIKITQTYGPITIKGITGDIDISLEDGAISILDSTKSVNAKSVTGSISVQQKRFDSNGILFLQSHTKGNITLSLPRETKALLHAKVTQGEIVSAHPVTMTQTLKLNKKEWERVKKDIDGILGAVKDYEEMERVRSEFPTITLEASKGSISIKEN